MAVSTHSVSSDVLTPAAALRALKQRTVVGGAVTLGVQGLKAVLRIVSIMILARLLAPGDFGLQGMVLVVTAFLTLFRDAGLSLATVQRREISHEQTSTLFWINVALGAGLALLLAAFAPALAAFYREPRLQGIAVVSSLAFVFGGLGVQHQALLQRELRFTTVAIIDLASAAGSTVIGIGMARAGWGYWALVGAAVAAPLLTTAGAWLSVPWVPGPPRRRSDVRSMLHLGGTWTFIGLLVYVSYNVEKALLGRFWGAASLGLYGRAYQLINLPAELITGSLGGVVIPALSRLQHDTGRLRRTFLACYSGVVSLTLPATMCCAVFAEEIVPVVLGPQWHAAIPALRALTPTMLAFALMNPFSWYLASTAQNRVSIRIALLVPPAVIAGVLFGIPHGPLGVAIGYSAAVCLVACPVIHLCRAAAGIPAADLWHVVRRPLLAGLGGAAAGYLVKWTVAGALPPLATLMLGGAAANAVYAWTLLVFFDQKTAYLDLVRSMVPRLLPDHR